MKKIFKFLFVYLAVGALVTSCEEVETGFDAITKVPDPTATYYLQFINAAQSLETGVTEEGDLIESEVPVGVVLMGMPRSEAITVNLTVDPATTLTSDMYSLSATSITIPAGQTSGSVMFETVAENMAPGDTEVLVLKLDAGEHNSPSVTGTTLTYNVKRMAFCPLSGGVTDFVGAWSAVDVGYDWGAEAPLSVTVPIATELSTDKLMVSGIGEAFIEQFWGEGIVDGGSFLMTVLGNGLVDIPRQYIYTTTYGGSPYEYEIKGSGKWENCGPKPIITITYDIYYVGEADGLTKQYVGYFGGVPYLTAVITKN